MSRVLPILFNTEMVRAILDGRKTVTRWVVKPKSKNACGFYVTFRKSDNAFMGVYDYDENEMQFDNSQTPPCQPGDILYVRETYKRNMDGYSGIDFGGYIYKADCSSGFKDLYNPWHPSIHMPKEAARIWLRVTDVRVERLQEIKLLEILREGVRVLQKVKEYGYERSEDDIGKAEYKRLWDSTLKKSDLDRYGWNANPWVWVIEFERCEKPEDI